MPFLNAGTEQGTPVEIYYEVHGAGKSVVLIHGWPLSGRSWEKHVPALVDVGYKVVTYSNSRAAWRGGAAVCIAG